jgi:hypothetical protein
VRTYRFFLNAFLFFGLFMSRGRGQSLAETIDRLKQDVDMLKARPQTQPQPDSLVGVRFGNGWSRYSNSGGRAVAYLGINNTDTGILTLSNASGLAEVTINAPPDGGANARFYNADGSKATVYIGTTGESGGILSLLNRTGSESATISSGQGGLGGYARFTNAKGKEIVYIGADKNDEGSVFLNSRKTFDYAEVFELADREGATPGTVMSMTPEGTGLAPATSAYDTRTVGVVSGAGGLQPGMRIGSRLDDSTDLPIALVGQVYVKVCSENGPIQVGDLLVSSNHAGVAMRSTDPQRSFGAVLGKALEPYAQDGEGLIRMLVMPR